MIKYHPKNARIKRDYFEWQKEANRKSDSTIDNIRKAIDRYERHTEFEDFRIFNKHKAIAFKKHLANTKSGNSRYPLSKATLTTPKSEHSRKPTEVYSTIESMYPDGKYLELFARNERDGWASWGAEVDGHACGEGSA